MTGGEARATRPNRGQTTLDFTVGVSIFLTVVLFTVAFIPTIFGPFTTDTGNSAVTADRVADRLAHDVLAVGSTSPGALDESCTETFFDGADDGSVTGCRYPDDADDPDDLRSVVGVDDATQVNVTIQDESGIRTIAGTRLAAGEEPTTVSDAVVARRAVLLGGEQSRLYVRVW
ncbi:MAG: hypothetical protein ABEJ43_01285 [Haloferacaceae archaeon]